MELRKKFLEKEVALLKQLLKTYLFLNHTHN
jgi:hypothetical protein